MNAKKANAKIRRFRSKSGSKVLQLQTLGDECILVGPIRRILTSKCIVLKYEQN